MVKEGVVRVYWTLSASKDLEEQCRLIHEESPKQAERVKAEIEAAVDELAEYPERHPPDRFKKDNPGNFRAFELYNRRIVYKHMDTEVYVLRVRHVREEPEES